MHDTLLSSEKNGYRLSIRYDGFNANPREEFDNVTTMFCLSRSGKFMLGDNQRNKKNPYKEGDFSSWEEMEKAIRKDFGVALIKPLYLYDHSITSISTESFIGRAQHAEWDSGRIGFVFITKEALKVEWGKNAGAAEWMEKILNAEVKLYDLYIRGEVYAFTLEKLGHCDCCDRDNEEIVASCGAFYGYGDWKENGLLEMVGEHVDDDTAAALVGALA